VSVPALRRFSVAGSRTSWADPRSRPACCHPAATRQEPARWNRHRHGPTREPPTAEFAAERARCRRWKRLPTAEDHYQPVLETYREASDEAPVRANGDGLEGAPGEDGDDRRAPAGPRICGIHELLAVAGYGEAQVASSGRLSPELDACLRAHSCLALERPLWRGYGNSSRNDQPDDARSDDESTPRADLSRCSANRSEHLSPRHCGHFAATWTLRCGSSLIAQDRRSQTQY